ncbi:NtaA/DmoA family FMN-dependent monooxygenase [Streptomyces sp. ICBB 8177]|uniref:NtaA/DmoA family FMN-dependent monooxygenase n=1 Tax=Streptomyces sp. ICBB 8177 TaxID=563922 RepID=UPI000D68387E|nr:NtaA/DmoA family FMN-dependent monooxygenase [Streptomyces sp. ICBB 8177]PWI41551.1 F420-dependent methylene-tetrahydromethanopterin reductase [Streptomyces sp. ICBB 8177]
MSKPPTGKPATTGTPATPGKPVTPGKPAKQIHLAAHFPGVNNTTVWSDPRAGSHIEFSSFAHFARTAERAKFDFLFLAEGLRLREQGGKIYDLDVVGRPDTFTVLAALAAVTDRIGLTGTINSTFNEPYEVARQFASLDHLSGGRSAWNVVTSWDAFTGENFRRGGFLPREERYSRAREFLATANELFDSWKGDEIAADQAAGVFLRDARAGAFRHTGQHFDIAGRFDVPRAPQGRPVVFQAGDSDEGREFAAADADAIFSRHSTLDAGREFYADVKRRLARHGRTHDQLLILPAATFVLGDTDAEARELAHEVRRQQVSGQTAIHYLEQVWNRDLSSYDPDGPLPDVDPDLTEHTIARGRAGVRMFRDPFATAREWREYAEAHKLSIRELIIDKTGRQSFVGSAATVAATIDAFVQADAADGFILVPHITPGGLDEFADTVVPLLQERGVFRTEYEGTTLRDHLGLAHPDAEPVADTASGTESVDERAAS